MEKLPRERRRDTRFGGAVTAALRATLRPGCVAAIVDVSAGGALVQAPRQLRPGSRVHLQVTTPTDTVALAGRVLRCAVWQLERDGGVIYRGALEFNERCETLWVANAHDGNHVPVSGRPAAIQSGNVVPVAVSLRPTRPADV